MKKYLIIGLLFLFSCQNNNNESKLQQEIDSLKIELQQVYKPGFGESMNWVNHHFQEIATGAKNQNWDYINFEIKEMTEALENIQKYQSDRKESLYLKMIDEPLLLLKQAVIDKDSVKFEKAYIKLTKTCNDCHQLTNHGFIRIQNYIDD